MCACGSLYYYFFDLTYHILRVAPYDDFIWHNWPYLFIWMAYFSCDALVGAWIYIRGLIEHGFPYPEGIHQDMSWYVINYLLHAYWFQWCLTRTDIMNCSHIELIFGLTHTCIEWIICLQTCHNPKMGLNGTFCISALIVMVKLSNTCSLNAAHQRGYGREC